MYMPRDTPATLPTRIGKLRDLTHEEDMPTAEEMRLWTYGEDDREDDETVHAMLDDAEDPQEAFKQHLHCGGAYVEEILDD